jgi:glutamate synthase (NADPH/NADH) small chain
MSDAAPDIKSGRLSKDEIDCNFSDLHPPLSRAEALIAADRCYFCFDAPCTTACPTVIDIPGFIQKIRSDNIRGSARTILEQNIMGGMCARVCPTEVLCEQACVRNTLEDRPIEIGLLQRYATDPILDAGTALFERQEASGFSVAVVGAGPAGLSCAHRLSLLGHDVVVYEQARKPGGLNEYGIAAYKTVDDFAQREADYILSLGGIDMCPGKSLGEDFTLDELRDEFDAVLLAIGLGEVNALGVEGEDLDGVLNAVDYIAELRQVGDKTRLPVGRNIVVVGGGMTAIDIAVQSRRLGADNVSIVYRRGPAQMGASTLEQDLAKTSGIQIHHWAQPLRVHGEARVSAIEFARIVPNDAGALDTAGETLMLEADVVFKAIGQRLDTAVSKDLETERGKIKTDERQKTSLDNVWAAGDCVAGGDDLTVYAVQQGKIAAIDIDRRLRA